MYHYQIGDIGFQWKENNFPLVQDEYMEQFQVISPMEDFYKNAIIYESHEIPLDRYRSYKRLVGNETYELYETEKDRLLIYHWAVCRFAFGYWLRDLETGNRISCYFHPDMKNQIPLSTVRFFSCAGMHSKLLQQGACVLHASYIDWKGRAIIFIAPSQTGKSTQADLWNRCTGAEIINGDRALVRKKKGIWYSYGYPCCGSSKICINRTLPLSLIVILEQGSENKIVPLTIGQKVRALVSGTELFPWNESEINQAFHLAKGLVQDINIVKLVCRPDADAVTTLKKYWEDNEYGKSV